MSAANTPAYSTTDEKGNFSLLVTGFFVIPLTIIP